MAESEQGSRRAHRHGVRSQVVITTASAIAPQQRNPARIPESSTSGVALQRIGGSVESSTRMSPISANSSGSSVVLRVDVGVHRNVSPRTIAPSLDSQGHLIVGYHSESSRGSRVEPQSLHREVILSDSSAVLEVTSHLATVEVHLRSVSMSGVQHQRPHRALTLESHGNVGGRADAPVHSRLTVNLVTSGRRQVLILVVSLKFNMSAVEIVDVRVSGSRASPPAGLDGSEGQMIGGLHLGPEVSRQAALRLQERSHGIVLHI